MQLTSPSEAVSCSPTQGLSQIVSPLIGWSADKSLLFPMSRTSIQIVFLSHQSLLFCICRINLCECSSKVLCDSVLVK
jgi:hypothetical protein